ncbi:YdeI family protein [Robiginitalea sp. SC105]|uniref:YdeI/OmpD-associated family protein n=1 Tax=Robiginitalea sp. SC105 TaxID=2762332 RepID=UPI00163A2050|nr:YdeI/OmpD-associated family protein [Robiginitalea sp. SC105]MBC2839926.1 YdeI/OmpD-associated family protein [Robiginitalea sp. SC105]
MEKSDRVAAYFEKEGPFKEGIAILRDLVRATGLKETYKWCFPVYTLGGENVVGVVAHTNHFGIWFFNGVFLSDPLGVLENAQEGKTRAMRHWKFTSLDNMDRQGITAYVQEAIANARKGLKLSPAKYTKTTLPTELKVSLAANAATKKAFEALPPYKQRDYAEYIETAKKDATRKRRLQKILPMIERGIGLNDKYRNC